MYRKYPLSLLVGFTSTRSTSLRRGWVALAASVYFTMLACEPAPAKLGKGKKFSIACPSGVIRDAGMMLPGNGVTGLVVGSLMAVSVPLFCRLWEKLPVRSSAVGVYLVCVPPDTNCPVYSCDQKKNSLFLLELKWCGM